MEKPAKFIFVINNISKEYRKVASNGGIINFRLFHMHGRLVLHELCLSPSLRGTSSAHTKAANY